jgi:hypothetical protein
LRPETKAKKSRHRSNVVSAETKLTEVVAIVDLFRGMEKDRGCETVAISLIRISIAPAMGGSCPLMAPSTTSPTTTNKMVTHSGNPPAGEQF